MSQPGVIHIEFHWPEKTGVLVYDASLTSAAAVVGYVKETTKREFDVVADRPFP